MSKRSNSGAPPAPPITFYVRCEVDARGPLKHITTETPLYEFQEFEVKLTNPFEVTPTAPLPCHSPAQWACLCAYCWAGDVAMSRFY